MIQRLRNPKRVVTIAVVGKYIRHNDAYKSIYESLDHAGIANTTKVIIRKIEGEDIELHGAESQLEGVDGILVPGGFGYRGFPVKSKRSGLPVKRISPSLASASGFNVR